MRGKITKMRGYSALIHLIIAETNAKIARTVIKIDRILCSFYMQAILLTRSW